MRTTHLATTACLSVVMLSASWTQSRAQEPARNSVDVATASGTTLLHLRARTFDPRDAAPAGLIGTRSPLQIVQFDHPPGASERAWLSTHGCRVVAAVPDQAWAVQVDDPEAFASMQRIASKQGGAERHGLRAVVAFPNTWRIDPNLLDAVAEKSRVAEVVHVMPFGAAEGLADAAHLVERVGGRVVDLRAGGAYLIAALNGTQIGAVAESSQIAWIDRHTEPGFDVDNARIQTGANLLEMVAGYNGAGVTGYVYEGVAAHPDLPRRIGLFDAGADMHGHCTFGILFGTGQGMASARGLLPAGTGVYTRFQGVSGSRLMHTDFGMRNHDVVFQTASWGNARTTQYTSVSADMDHMIWTLDLPVTQAHGNSLNEARPQSWAKNVISVGGVFHNNNADPSDDVWAIGAGTGPASDGRIKPDLVAYYDSVLCTDLVGAAGYTPGNYNPNFGGTSAATPIVAGVLGLTIEMFADGVFGNDLPVPGGTVFQNRGHASTSRALLVHGARSYPIPVPPSTQPPRFEQGWGFPSVEDLWTRRQSMLVIDEDVVLSQGDVHSWLVNVPAGSPQLRLTMVYTDPPAMPSLTVHRVNDLDLSLRQLSTGQVLHGNVGLQLGNVSTPGGQPDGLNTTENIFIDAPPPGLYEARVAAPLVSTDAHLETTAVDADFALVVTGIDGYRTQPGMVLAVATSPGTVTFLPTGVPASGWSEGFTLLSFSTAGSTGLGRFFGLEADGLTEFGVGQAVQAGNLLHFSNTPNVYPFAPLTLPNGVAATLRGATLDTSLILTQQGAVTQVSPVTRFLVQ